MAWTPRHGTLTIEDGTGGTPLDVDLAHEDADFTVSGLIQGNKELTPLYDRGAFDELVEGQDIQITGSMSYRIDDVASSTDAPIDAALKLGNFASAVSTHSSGDGVLYTLKWVVARGGNTFTFTFAKVLFTADLSEQFPANTASFNWTCFGGLSVTKA